MGMAAAKVYCVCEDIESQKKFVKQFSGYKLDKTTHVFKNEEVIEMVDVPSGLIIARYNTKNMSEAIRQFNADSSIQDKLNVARNKTSYVEACETLKNLIMEYNTK